MYRKRKKKRRKDDANIKANLKIVHNEDSYA